ncbi:FUSC family protein [Romboutsia sp.]|uniref:FUSC family protein n=1 Tax=Romboutsia sp. TaxID=1965302 RepID=UPI003F35CCD1
MKLKKVGMRTIKTGIAVALCVLAGKYLVQNPMYAAVGCIVSVQDTVKGSVKLGLNRIKGTVLGGLIGYLCVIIRPGDPILSGLGTMATIYGCTTLNITSGIVVSSVTFLSIQLGVITSNPGYYSIHRIIDTSVGVIIGVLVNYLLVRPNYVENISLHLDKIEKMVKENIEAKIINKRDFSIVKLEKEIKKLEGIYSKLVDEINYSKNDADLENLEKEISLCKEIYFHMQSIELLEQKLYITGKNYKSIKILLKIKTMSWELDEEASPVFNYHLGKIIEEINLLKTLNNSN